MRKVILLAIGCALFGSISDASAQGGSSRGSAAVKSGYIGIRFQDERFVSGATSNMRVLVQDVSKDSPAAKAGIRAGDEILRINGLSAANGKFSALARTLTEGDTVKLRIKRDNKELDYTVVAAARPNTYTSMHGQRTIMISGDSIRELMSDYLESARIHLDSLKLPRVWVHSDDSTFDIRVQRFKMAPPDSVFFGPPGDVLREHFEGELGPGMIFRSFDIGSRAIAGAEFTDLDPAMKSYFGTDRGLLTLRVAPGTPAARAGLQVGDVLIKADNKEIKSIADLRAVVFNNVESKTLKVEVMRKGQSKTLEIATPTRILKE